jgi:hypothetical protein
MKIPIEQVPQYVAHCRDMAKTYRQRYEEILEKAKTETDPAERRRHEKHAQSVLDVVTSHEAEADELTEKFKAAGGQLHRLQ